MTVNRWIFSEDMRATRVAATRKRTGKINLVTSHLSKGSGRPGYKAHLQEVWRNN